MRLRNLSAAEDHQQGTGEVAGPGTRLLPGRGPQRSGRRRHRKQRLCLRRGTRQGRPVHRTVVERPRVRLHEVRDLRIRSIARTGMPVSASLQ